MGKEQWKTMRQQVGSTDRVIKIGYTAGLNTYHDAKVTDEEASKKDPRLH
jgi:hypothetical protein